MQEVIAGCSRAWLIERRRPLDVTKPIATTLWCSKEVKATLDRVAVRDFIVIDHLGGINYHEATFLDIGDDTVIKPGITLTVEPGICIKGLGGFRHTDKIATTEDWYEQLTKYTERIE